MASVQIVEPEAKKRRLNLQSQSDAADERISEQFWAKLTFVESSISNQHQILEFMGFVQPSFFCLKNEALEKLRLAHMFDAWYSIAERLSPPYRPKHILAYIYRELGLDANYLQLVRNEDEDKLITSDFETLEDIFRYIIYEEIATSEDTILM